MSKLVVTEDNNLGYVKLTPSSFIFSKAHELWDNILNKEII